jgi:hypothetical protein
MYNGDPELLQSIGLVPGGEYQLVILESIGDVMCCGYGDGSAALYATADDSDLLITSCNSVPVMNDPKSMLHRIPNDLSFVFSVLSQCCPYLK